MQDKGFICGAIAPFFVEKSLPKKGSIMPITSRTETTVHHHINYTNESPVLEALDITIDPDNCVITISITNDNEQEDPIAITMLYSNFTDLITRICNVLD